MEPYGTFVQPPIWKSRAAGLLGACCGARLLAGAPGALAQSPLPSTERAIPPPDDTPACGDAPKSLPALRAAGVGQGEEHLKVDPEPYRQAGEVAALVSAVRALGEANVGFGKNVSLGAGPDRERSIRAVAGHAPCAEPAPRDGLSRNEDAERAPLFSSPFPPWMLFDPDPQSQTGATMSGGSMQVGALTLVWMTLVDQFLVTDDLIWLRAGEHVVRVRNFATRDVEAAPAVVSALQQHGFQWTFAYHPDGSVTCRLTSPLSAVKPRRESQ